jgi:hypothetical protein
VAEIRPRQLRILRIVAVIELATLVILVGNRLGPRHEIVTSLVVPIHGTAYLAVLLAAFTATSITSARLRALIPGIGGTLAVRDLLRRHS